MFNIKTEPASNLPEKVEVGSIKVVQQNPLWPKAKQSRGWKSVHVCPDYDNEDDKDHNEDNNDDNCGN